MRVVPSAGPVATSGMVAAVIATADAENCDVLPTGGVISVVVAVIRSSSLAVPRSTVPEKEAVPPAPIVTVIRPR